MIKTIFAVVATVATLSYAAFAAVPRVAAAGARDCDTNAIVECGALDAAELKQKYTANKTGDIDEVYTKYGISSTMVGSSQVKMGSVTKDGKVIVDGKTVATGAQSVGREDMTGSTKVTIGGKTFYQRPTSVSFAAESIPAFVFMNEKGEFAAAVITSCGNPVKATPVKVTPPKPQPQPSFTCDSLSASNTNGTTRRFSAKATAKNGATVTGYKFDFGDGSSQETTARTISHEYNEAGDYDAKVTAMVKVGTETKEVEGEKCVLGVTITKPNTPVTPVAKCEIKGKEDIDKTSADCKEDTSPAPETPEVLPSTGPEALIGGGLGLGSLTAAGYYYRASRRHLIDRMLGR